MEGGVRARLSPGSARCSPSTTRATTATCGRCSAGILAAYAGISVDDFEAQSDAFLRTTQHPTLGRGYLECAYAPMVELLGYLEANGFANYIVSGGGRDFMRPISQEHLRHPARSGDRKRGRARVHRATTKAARSRTSAEADYLDDGPQKPIRIWSRTGRRPLLAAGNSNGDIEMLEFTQLTTSRRSPARPPRRRRARVRLHQRCRAGAGASRTEGWTVVSMKNDWTTVF